MYFIFHLKKFLFRQKPRVRANFGWRIRFRHLNWPSYLFRGRMVQIMGFWPILTIFWSGLQKFKSIILRVECFLRAIKNLNSPYLWGTPISIFSQIWQIHKKYRVGLWKISQFSGGSDHMNFWSKIKYSNIPQKQCFRIN